MAGRAASRYARHAVGGAAAMGLGLGVAGAMGQIMMFATALPPTVSAGDEARMYQGFDEATQSRYSGNPAADQANARNAVVLAAGAAAVSAARPAARRMA